MYDGASRLTGQQYQDGTRATFTYDANSRRTVLSDWTGSYTSTYDQLGRVSSTVNPAGIAITYAYDAIGQREKMVQPTGTFTYVYDPANRVSNLTNPEGHVTTWSYDPVSRLTQQLLANGVVVSNIYDNADRLLVLANIGTGGTTLSSFAYTYDRVGNRTQVIELDGSVVTWIYDEMYQLTHEQRSGPSAYNITYTYDGVGNRTLMAKNGALTTYAYNSGNEIATSQTSAGITTYTFDNDGNQLTTLGPGNQLTTNTWDGENRLTTVALPSGITNTFTYNGDGQRVQKQDSNGTTNGVWDRDNILLETGAQNNTLAVYTLEPDSDGKLVSQIRGVTDSYYLFDGLGSTRCIAGDSGAVTDTYLYSSFAATKGFTRARAAARCVRGVLTRSPRHRAAEVWRIRRSRSRGQASIAMWGARPGTQARPRLRSWPLDRRSGCSSAEPYPPPRPTPIVAAPWLGANRPMKLSRLGKRGGASRCVAAGLVFGAYPLGFSPRSSKTVLPLAGITDTGPARGG